MTGYQSAFAAALLDPEASPPLSLRVRDGDSMERCFAVYRNNVAVSLVDALAERFPVCQRLVGEEFFRAMARLYVAQSPPSSPLLMTYGDGLAEFIAAFPPAQSVPYLADVAYLEAALTRAYNAPDAEPLDAAAFTAIDPETLPDCRIGLHPSIEIIRSPWAIGTIWSANKDEHEPAALDPSQAEDLVVVRPSLDVELHRLSADGHAEFLIALAQGETLSVAASAASAACADFDPADAFAMLVSLKLTCDIRLPSS